MPYVLAIPDAAVVPTLRKRPAVSIAPGFADPGFQPDQTQLHVASGGFNCVVQVSAQHCSRVYDQQVLDHQALVHIGYASLQEFYDEQEDPFDAEALNDLKDTLPLHPAYVLATTLRPTGLVFQNARQVCINYRAEVSLLVEVDPLPLDTPLPPIGDWFPPPQWPTLGPLPAPDWSPGRAITGPRAGLSFVGPRALEQSRSLDGISRPRLAPTALGALQQGLFWYRKGYRLIHSFGSYAISCCCNYGHEANNTLKRVSIYADLTTATFTFEEPSGDFARFHDRFLMHHRGSVEAMLAQSERVHVAPTISLAGRNPPHIPVTEIGHFDVSVFHVGDAPRQAIVAAFDIKPGCQGIIEDVHHFIGSKDYGVISDECLIESVFKHKWRIGGFDRRLPLSKTIEVTRDGHLEDAELHGELELKTLDHVTVECEATTRTDYIRIGGAARSQATSIILSDGTVLDPEDVDFGGPTDTPWSMFTSLKIQPELSADFQIRQFQQRAHEDAYQHVSRPFANIPLHDTAISIMYTRVEGVSKYIYVLSDVSEVFV